MARVVLIEPYYAGSHRAWADGWRANSRHEVSLITHSGDFWRWRMRGGPVTLAEQISAHVAEFGQPDAVVVSEMTDVAALVGLARRELAGVPVGLYVHESQLLYPLGPSQVPNEALSLVNWKSMVAADRIWFNSAFHRDAFFGALPRLLNHMPDQRHTDLIPNVERRSSVLHVGVETRRLIDAPRTLAGSAPLVLWNQRWDHDKNPEAVFSALIKLAEAGIEFEFALAGENQRVDPQEFAWVQQELGDRVVHVGHVDREAYLSLLLRSDVVVSAAHHEFFGIAIVEALAAGAVPVLPTRLSFPEIVPPEFHAAALYPDGDLRVRLGEVLADIDAARQQSGGLREAMGVYDWSVVAPAYDDEIEALIAGT